MNALDLPDVRLYGDAETATRTLIPSRDELCGADVTAIRTWATNHPEIPRRDILIMLCREFPSAGARALSAVLDNRSWEDATYAPVDRPNRGIW